VESLKAKADEEHGEALEAAVDKYGDVTGRFSVESFVFWAKSKENLPDGSRRRQLK